MAGVNKVIILGYLGADPEIRTMPDGGAVANISVATSEVWNDRNTNERREKTEWHRIVFYRRQAEICGEYLRKGSQIYVEGRLQTRKWQDQNGQDRYTTEIIGDTLQMLGGRNNGQQGSYQDSQGVYHAQQAPQGNQRAPIKPSRQSKAAPSIPTVDNQAPQYALHPQAAPSPAMDDQMVNDSIPF